jgi:hypothetical protein
MTTVQSWESIAKANRSSAIAFFLSVPQSISFFLFHNRIKVMNSQNTISTKEATEKLLNSIKTQAALLHIASQCTNLYGFWILEGVPKGKIEPIVRFLVRMNELNQLGYEAQDDRVRLDIDKRKRALQEECGFTVYGAIAELVDLLQLIVSPSS